MERKKQKIIADTIIHARILIKYLCMLIFFVLSADIAWAYPQANILHHMTINIIPSKHYISVSDYIQFNKRPKQPLEFALSPQLHIRIETHGVEARILFKPHKSSLAPTIYRLYLHGRDRIKISYHGKIYYPLYGTQGSYEMGMKSTPGIIFKQGAYLSPFCFWYPMFQQGPIEFSIKAVIPSNWKIVTQGKRIATTQKGNNRIELWRCNTPQQGIYLYASKLFEYDSTPKKGPKIYIFMREKAPDLAQQYLHAATKYIKFYSSLIAPYPYPKFALAENFWETGYGMPSFTLIGPMVLRLPFIIHTSFPHEILHNWWGNSVWVNYKSGNWCEGLTAYMADYLLQERQGKGKWYRLAILQKYSAFVPPGKGFPIKDFREKNNELQEAIGYGKSLMTFHMLRFLIGNRDFIKGLRLFYNKYQFRVAGFNDINTCFSKISGEDLSWFFKQWVDRKGAPALVLGNVSVKQGKTNFVIKATLEQIQEGNAWRIKIPLIITLKGRINGIRKWVDMTQKRETFSITVPCQPVRLDVDPNWQVFRRLLPGQAPSSLYELFGAQKIAIVIPNNTKQPMGKAYQTLAKEWASSDPRIEVINSSSLNTIINGPTPPDAVWIMGIHNNALSWAGPLLSRLKQYGTDINDITMKRAKLTTVICGDKISNRGNDIAVALLASYSPKALMSIASRLVHYGKYSFLIFTGAPARCIKQGIWKTGPPASLTWHTGTTMPPMGHIQKDQLTVTSSPKK